MTRLHACFSTLLIAAICSVAPAAAQPPGWDAFTQTFDGYVQRDATVGASVLFMRDGQVLARHNTGFADRAANRAVDDETIFHWGSITKALTAIGIMQLRDRGLLTLDDKVIDYIPELRRVHDPYGMMDSVTIRMLLSHTAGFQSPTWPYGDGEAWQPFEPTEWDQLVAMMPYQRLLFRPGERYGYSNPAYVYLGRIIEQLTGDPWDAYVYKNFFVPLRMERSYFRTTPSYLASQRSHHYTAQRDSTGALRITDLGTEFDPGITSANGAWNAPLSDLVRYVAFLTNKLPAGSPPATPYRTLLRHESLREMWQPVKPMGPVASDADAIEVWMGLSFFVVKQGERTLLGHTGSQGGFISFFFFNPETSAAVIAAFNTNNFDTPGAEFTALTEAAYALLW